MPNHTPNPTPEQFEPLNSSCDSSSPNDRAEETACAAGLEDRLDECFDNAEQAAIELRGFADMLLAMPDRAELDCQWLGGKLVDILRMVERAWPGTADRILRSAALKQAGAAPASEPAAEAGAPHVSMFRLNVEIPLRNLRGVANILEWGQGGTLDDDATELMATDIKRAVKEIETAAGRAAA